MLRDPYCTREDKTYDVVERPRISSQNNRDCSFRLSPMDSQPRANAPHGLTTEDLGRHHVRQPSPDGHSPSTNLPPAYGYHCINPRSAESRYKTSNDREHISPSIPGTQSGSQGTVLPPFNLTFGDYLPPDTFRRVVSTPSSNRDLSNAEHDARLANLNQPRRGVYPQPPHPEHQVRRESIGSSDPRSLALGPGASKKRKATHEDEEVTPLRIYQNEVTYSTPASRERMNSFQPPRDSRPESSGRGGSQHSSGRSSPARQNLHNQPLPTLLPPVETMSRGVASPRTPSDPRDHTRPTNYVYGNGRPGAQTYPQTSGSFVPPAIADPYHYEQPRHGYSWSGASSHSSSNQQPYSQHPYAHGSSYGMSDRSPFSMGPAHSYADSYRATPMRELGVARQRRRRGNLPKETTDVLRTWFHSHLSHPYPSEDEKQEMMRQTGLQINQISNWFINARRRQLPALVKNQEAVDERSKTASNGLLTPSKSLSPQKNQPGDIEEDQGFDEYMEEEDPSFEDGSESARHSFELAPMHQGRRSDLVPLSEQHHKYEGSPEKPRGHGAYPQSMNSVVLERERDYPQKLTGTSN